MATACEGGFDSEGILSDELAVLESIYITELSVEKDADGWPYTISVLLHPNTGMDESKKYVCMTLLFKLSRDYPQEIPGIAVRNPRGLGEEEIHSLIEDMKKLAEEKREGPMLFELIEMAKECLTEGNIPHGECPICLENFSETEPFVKTDCYHHFHHLCLARYAQAFEAKRQDENEDSAPMHVAKEEAESDLVCPMCRLPLTCDLAALLSEPVPAEEKITFVPSPELKQQQEQMSALYLQQKNKGGIIDPEHERNKFLVDENTVVSLDSLVKRDQELQESNKDNLPSSLSQSETGEEHRNRQQRPYSGRSNQQRERQQNSSGKDRERRDNQRDERRNYRGEGRDRGYNRNNFKGEGRGRGYNKGEGRDSGYGRKENRGDRRNSGYNRRDYRGEERDSGYRKDYRDNRQDRVRDSGPQNREDVPRKDNHDRSLDAGRDWRSDVRRDPRLADQYEKPRSSEALRGEKDGQNYVQGRTHDQDSPRNGNYRRNDKRIDRDRQPRDGFPRNRPERDGLDHRSYRDDQQNRDVARKHERNQDSFEARRDAEPLSRENSDQSRSQGKETRDDSTAPSQGAVKVFSESAEERTYHLKNSQPPSSTFNQDVGDRRHKGFDGRNSFPHERRGGWQGRKRGKPHNSHSRSQNAFYERDKESDSGSVKDGQSKHDHREPLSNGTTEDWDAECVSHEKQKAKNPQQHLGRESPYIRSKRDTQPQSARSDHAREEVSSSGITEDWDAECENVENFQNSSRGRRGGFPRKKAYVPKQKDSKPQETQHEDNREVTLSRTSGWHGPALKGTCNENPTQHPEIPHSKRVPGNLGPPPGFQVSGPPLTSSQTDRVRKAAASDTAVTTSVKPPPGFKSIHHDFS